MKPNPHPGLSARKSKLVIVAVVAATILLVSSAWAWFRDTSASYSVLQKWEQYHSVEDWNLSKHALADIDGDGKTDIVTFLNCAFLTSVHAEDIPEELRCKQPGFSALAFGDGEKVGQKLVPEKPFLFSWLKKSYLVKDNTWRFYDMDGFQLRVYEFDASTGLFVEKSPSLLDQLDMLLYQIGHIGILLIIQPFFIYSLS